MRPHHAVRYRSPHHADLSTPCPAGVCGGEEAVAAAVRAVDAPEALVARAGAAASRAPLARDGAAPGAVRRRAARVRLVRAQGDQREPVRVVGAHLRRLGAEQGRLAGAHEAPLSHQRRQRAGRLRLRLRGGVGLGQQERERRRVGRRTGRLLPCRVGQGQRHGGLRGRGSRRQADPEPVLGQSAGENILQECHRADEVIETVGSRCTLVEKRSEEGLFEGDDGN